MILSCMLGVKQSRGLTERNKIGMRGQQMWSLHFYWGSLRTHANLKPPSSGNSFPQNTAPHLPPKRVICLLRLGLLFPLWVQPLGGQWSGTQRQRAPLGVGANSDSQGSEGRRKDKTQEACFLCG